MTPTALDGLLLGLVQGLTEFLPISSSGHLILTQDVLGFQPPGIFFEVGLHIATLIAVLVAYRARIGALTTGLFRRDHESWGYAGLLLLGSAPAAIAGLGFRDLLASTFEPGPMLGVSFLATAAVLWSTRWAPPGAGRVTARVAILIGIAQAVSILPALSRSGLTIAAAMWLGVPAVVAAEFSFLLAVIAIGGSGLLEIQYLPADLDLLTPGLLIAFVAAVVSGVWAIRFLVRLLDRGRFHVFAWYCAIVGVATGLWYLVIAT